MILAGDIGGTRARLTLLAPGGRRPERTEIFESRAFGSLEQVAQQFLGRRPPKVSAACFGVAGPVIDQRCNATNLPWKIDARRLASKLGVAKVALINDLVALGFGALTVPPRKLRVLQNGAPKKRGGNVAILAAGTGLGEAALIWDGDRFVPLATEGGHSDFAPRNDLEIELLRFLRDRLQGRVSYERILSGPGLGNLYDFFCESKGAKEARAVSAAIAKAPDRNAEIARAGLAGESAAASRAIDLFVDVYGAEAGNLALKTLSVGGLYVAGNIANAFAPRIEGGAFLRAFLDKGRFSTLLGQVPVALVTDTDIGLSGAAYYASHGLA